jgi:hypothetical protein
VTRASRLAVAAALAVALAAIGLLAERHPALFALKFSVQRSPELMPSSLAVPDEELRRGLPTLSMSLSQHDLYDRATGILANTQQHGRAWERRGTISYFEGGRVLFASTAGVRVHGGGSRVTSPRQGYRVYLRREYGASTIPPGLVFGRSHTHPIRVLVVHNDVRYRLGTEWALSNPLAFDIVNAVGGIASPAVPVRFLLNGQFQGVFVLYEHFHPKHYFPAHGRRAVRLNAAEFEALWNQVRALDRVTIETVGDLVDLDNLTRWFIATAFCGTRDPFQGPSQFRDEGRPRAQWFWVNWDMDESFGNVRQDPFNDLLIPPGGARRGRRDDEVRPYLMTALLAQDPAYREIFKARWIEAMNFQITPAFLRERFDHYRQIARTYGVAKLDYLQPLEAFLTERPRVLREQAARYLRTPAVSCSVVSTLPVLVDGHQVSGRFDGYYFRGMRVMLDVPTEDATRFSHWRLNGTPQPRGQTVVTFTANEDVTIQAIWR